MRISQELPEMRLAFSWVNLQWDHTAARLYLTCLNGSLFKVSRRRDYRDSPHIMESGLPCFLAVFHSFFELDMFSKELGHGGLLCLVAAKNSDHIGSP